MRRVSRHAEVDVLVRELNEWTHTSAFKPKWMRLHARSELGVAVQNQKRLLTSPTTPELLKRVVYVHFKYFCRCTLRSWAPLLCGCRKEFWHRGLPLSDALPRRTRRWSAPIGVSSWRCSDATLFSRLPEPARDDTHAPRPSSPYGNGGEDTAAHGEPERAHVVASEIVQHSRHPRPKSGSDP